MNIIEKIVSYFCLRAEGFNHETAVQEFKRNPITFEDKVVIVYVVFVAIVVAVLMYDAHHNKQIEATLEQQRIAEHQRKVAENQAIKHEQIVLTMLNGGYIRVDGITRKTCIKDYNGDCM